MQWSGPQHRAIAFAGDDSASALCAAGPTQSGKSISNAYGLAYFIVENEWPEDFDGFAVMGPRLVQVHSALNNIGMACAEFSVPFKKFANASAEINGYKISGHSIGRRESHYSFHGQRYGAILIEETTLCDKDTVMLAEGRVNKPPIGKTRGKLFMSTNPDSPHHWLKADRIDAGKCVHVPSTIEDNPSLTDEFKERLRTLWRGPMLQRMYYGQWVGHSGLVYPLFMEQCVDAAPRIEEDEEPWAFDLVVDHATAGVTHALLIAVYRRHRRGIAEWRHDGRTQGWLTTADQAQAIGSELVWEHPLRRVYCDPAAAHMVADLERYVGKVEPTLNAVLPGIQQTMLLMADGWFSVDPSCVWTIRESASYAWDDRAEQRGQRDRPLKVNDHAPDCIRYYLHSEAEIEDIVLRYWS